MKKNLYLMFAIAFLQGMVFYGPIATLYRQAQGISVFQVTLIESISLALAILLEVPWGILADKIGYRKTMVVCSGLYFVSKVVFWQADSFGDFLWERILLSVVIAGYSGVDSSIVYLSCKEGDSQKALGIYNGMGMLGLLLAAGVFSLLIKNRYSLAGLLTAVSYGAALLLSFFLKEVCPTKRKKTQGEAFLSVLRSTFRRPAILLFLIAAALLSESHQTITVFLNQLQYERCGLSSSVMGLLYMVATLFGLFSVYSSVLTKRLGVGKCCLFFRFSVNSWGK